MLEAYGLKTHIWNNNLRSILLLIFFPLLLLFLAYGLILLWLGFAEEMTLDQGLFYAAEQLPLMGTIALSASAGWFIL